MILSILITFVALVGLLVLHEFGHFVMAKKFGVKVEEFGVGYPPRIFGKKIGETIYSINLLPFGAFVKILGEDERIDDPRSFNKKPIWQRALILVAGCLSFWIVSAILLSIVFGLGAPIAVGDEENHNLIDPKIQIISIAPGSPAAEAGLKIEDVILQLRTSDQKLLLNVNKVKDVIEFTQANKGKEIILTIQRGEELLDVSLVPRIEPPTGQGPIGIGLVRTAIKVYPWYLAPVQGIKATGNLTLAMIQGWGKITAELLKGKGIPSGAEIAGPVRIFVMMKERIEIGFVNFLSFIAMISVAVALVNLLPIPAVDGGRLLFLAIEGVFKKPIPQEIERKINAFFFALLIALMIWVTIQDIQRLL